MKKMVVNCAMCDMTCVREETLAAYEKILINAANVLVSPETKILIDRYPVQINTAHVMEAPAGTEVRQHNGKYVLSAGSGINGNAILMVNGSVLIENGALEAAESYRGIHVNGKVVAPRSIVDRLHNLNVNGKVVAYPDGAVLLKSTEVIDRFFALRARKALYYADSCIVITDRDIDARKIIDKGAEFETPRVIIAENFCEALIPLIDEKAEICVVPEGTAFIKGDAVLDAVLVRKNGSRLYINGDLTVRDDKALAGVEKLYVSGTVRVAERLKEAFGQLDAEYDEMEIVREYDLEMRDRIMAKIDSRILANNPGGVLVADCVNVKIDKDVNEALILERLVMRDVVQVSCSPEQESAVAAVSTDVAQISAGEGGGLKKLLEHDPDTRVINAATYVM